MEKKQKIKNIISDTLGVPLPNLEDNADFIEDLNAQELEISDLISKLEAQFSVELSADEKNSIKTVNDILEIFISD